MMPSDAFLKDESSPHGVAEEALGIELACHVPQSTCLNQIIPTHERKGQLRMEISKSLLNHQAQQGWQTP